MIKNSETIICRLFTEIEFYFDKDTKKVNINVNKSFTKNESLKLPELHPLSAFHCYRFFKNFSEYSFFSQKNDKIIFKNFDEFLNKLGINYNDIENFDLDDDDKTDIVFLFFGTPLNQDYILNEFISNYIDTLNLEEEQIYEIDEKIELEEMAVYVFEFVFGSESKIDQIIETSELKDFNKEIQFGIKDYIDSLI